MVSPNRKRRFEVITPFWLAISESCLLVSSDVMTQTPPSQNPLTDVDECSSMRLMTRVPPLAPSWRRKAKHRQKVESRLW